MAAVLSPLSPVCASCSLQRVVLEQAALIESLQGRIAELERRNAELEARLARYENPHVPSSRLEKPSSPSKSNGKRGRPAGCEGSTRPTPVPSRLVPVVAEVCPRCSSPLELPDASVPSVLASISGNYSRVMAYENGYKTYDPALPDFSTLREMRPYLGYWIKATRPEVLEY